MKFFIICLIVCVIACLIVLYIKAQKKVFIIKDIQRKKIEGTLSFGDVVGWFKTINDLNQNEDTPFIADMQKNDDLKKMHFVLNVEMTNGKRALLLGVYNEKLNKLTHSYLIESDSFDDKITEILGNESFVVLQ